MTFEKAKPGDKVQLARREGILVDYETGFEITNDETKKLGNPIGKRTQLAVQSGGLLVIDSKPAKTKVPKSENTNDPADLPDDFPGRDVLIGLGVASLDAVDKMDKAALVELKGIGDKTAEAILEYLKK